MSHADVQNLMPVLLHIFLNEMGIICFEYVLELHYLANQVELEECNTHWKD